MQRYKQIVKFLTFILQKFYKKEALNEALFTNLFIFAKQKYPKFYNKKLAFKKKT